MTDAPTVAFQGEPGAFSEEAVLAYFGDGAGTSAVPTWRAVFEAVASGAVDAGVVAIESSLAGSIRETYDLLSEFYDAGVRIVGEVSVPVRLALVALPGQSIDWIERVYSHAQALAQADEFLRSREWQVLTTYNTAGAARMIADGQERGSAAIASPRVATIYGLEVLADNVQSGDENRTRFAVLALEGSDVGPPHSLLRTPLARRRSSSRSATCPGRFTAAWGRSRRAASTCPASSRARPGPRAGSTTSGSTSTPARTTRPARLRSTSSGLRPRQSALSAATPEPRRTNRLLPRFRRGRARRSSVMLPLAGGTMAARSRGVP